MTSRLSFVKPLHHMAETHMDFYKVGVRYAYTLLTTLPRLHFMDYTGSFVVVVEMPLVKLALKLPRAA